MRTEALIKAQNKYKEIHKDEINKKQNAKIQCECGCISTYSVIARHRKSKKHQKNLIKK